VDGRKGQSDVDILAAALRGTGIHDLFVHAGPFRNDGTLDAGLRPRARWLIGALHTALPGVRVQAWLGAHPVPGQLRLDSACLIAAVGQVLDDGFDGVHYDFEPVDDGNTDLVTLLAATHLLTRQRHSMLSLSASFLAPLPGIGKVAAALPGHLVVWSPGYLHQLAQRVDQVAVMAYDTGLWTQATYAGYVRRATELALGAVPPGVALLIGVPAYREQLAPPQRRGNHAGRLARRSTRARHAPATTGFRGRRLRRLRRARHGLGKLPTRLGEHHDADTVTAFPARLGSHIPRPYPGAAVQSCATMSPHLTSSTRSFSGNSPPLLNFADRLR
jgi:hypothetical protein